MAETHGYCELLFEEMIYGVISGRCSADTLDAELAIYKELSVCEALV